jgi:sulfopyruvate decarboxylase TPP-binding subunit
MDEHDDAPAKWQDELYDLLRRNNVTQFAYVPDAGHRILIDRSLADPQAHSVALTTEEEGVALLAGADLGGARGVLLMQSSGTGNCINMLSLIKGGRFPFLTLVSMRGDFGEGNPPGSFRWVRRSSPSWQRWASSACGSNGRRRSSRPSAPH